MACPYEVGWLMFREATHAFILPILGRALQKKMMGTGRHVSELCTHVPELSRLLLQALSVLLRCI